MVKMAIISDLHCHSPSDTGDAGNTSFLRTDLLRDPPGNHPVQSFIELITTNGLEADVLLCPGDLAHQVSKEGFIYSVTCLFEITNALGECQLLSTIGNHDVNRVDDSNKGPFNVARNAHPDFPFEDEEDSDIFWSRSFCVKECAGIEFVIINTSHDHFTADAARSGSFNDQKIQSLKSTLSNRSYEGLRVALMHHHPTVHSIADFDSSDVLPTGDQLLNVFAEFNANLVIHGHRHFPRIERVHRNGQMLFILGAGSFSRFLNELGGKTRNLFHIVEIPNEDEAHQTCRGTITSWEFHYGDGWKRASEHASTFPHQITLSPPQQINDLVNEIEKYFNSDGSPLIENEVQEEFSDLDDLLPKEMEALQQQLFDRGIKLKTDDYGSISFLSPIE